MLISKRLWKAVQRPCLSIHTYSTNANTNTSYVTTPIFYVNAVPHIGHLHTMVLADVIHRYAKLKADSSSQKVPLLATGTDEHGLKIEQSAIAANTTEIELCDRVSGRFRDLAAVADMDYSDFIRTSEARHKVAVHHLWNKLYETGHIYKGTHSGWYAVADEAYYPNKGVEDYVDPKTREKQKVSKETGRVVEWVEEENYKLKLEPFKERLIKYLSLEGTVKPEGIRKQLLSNLNEGPLPDLSISRPTSRLKWGIRVPNDENHTIYVWFDALINYLTVTGYPWSTDSQEEKKIYWPANVHVIGKDIARFHAVYWPIILMAADLPLPKSIVSHAHWTMEKSKMSKSLGNVVDPYKVIDDYGVDAIRFYLMRIGGYLNDDSDFSYTQLDTTYRKDLIGTFGNLLQRMCGKSMLKRTNLPDQGQSLLSQFPNDIRDTEVDLNSALQKLPENFEYHMDRIEPAKALEVIFDTLSEANRMIATVEPWRIKDDTDATVSRCISYTVETLRMAAICLQPFIPKSSTELLDRIGIPQFERTWDYVKFGSGSSTGLDTKTKSPLYQNRNLMQN